MNSPGRRQISLLKTNHLDSIFRGNPTEKKGGPIFDVRTLNVIENKQQERGAETMLMKIKDLLVFLKRC